MEATIIKLNPRETFSTVALHEVVTVLADSLSVAAVSKKSFILNDVPENIVIQTDAGLVESALGKLLNMVIRHTENSCIRITAKTFGNVVLLHIKDDGCLCYDSMSENLNNIQSLAERMGGYVGFTSFRNKLTTIALSFVNAKKAA
jgi:K+-sensing histidine kinase KdpD